MQAYRRVPAADKDWCSGKCYLLGSRIKLWKNDQLSSIKTTGLLSKKKSRALCKRHVNGVCVCRSVCVTESHDHMNNMTCRKERSPVVTSWQRNTACVKIGSKQGINIETK